jgi:hypothetical protein
MVKKDSKRMYESETLILPAIKMVLTGSDPNQQSAGKESKTPRKNHPNQNTVMRIIEALNKAE